jgi:hypothetical protein
MPLKEYEVRNILTNTIVVEAYLDLLSRNLFTHPNSYPEDVEKELPKIIEMVGILSRTTTRLLEIYDNRNSNLT